MVNIPWLGLFDADEKPKPSPVPDVSKPAPEPGDRFIGLEIVHVFEFRGKTYVKYLFYGEGVLTVTVDDFWRMRPYPLPRNSS